MPAITVGLRGIMYAQIDVSCRRSTSTPAATAARSRTRPTPWPTIIAALKGPDGRIRMPGLLRRRRRRSPATSATRSPPCRSTRRRSATRSACRRSSARPASRRSSDSGVRPTLDVNGIWGGFQGEGAKTIIPAHAHAKVTAGWSPTRTRRRVFERFRDYVAPGRAARRDGRGPRTSARRAPEPDARPTTRRPRPPRGRSRRVRRGPGLIREGGSIPVTAMFEHDLGLPVVLLGFTQPDEQRARARTSGVLVENYERGTRVIVRLWDELAAARSSDGDQPVRRCDGLGEARRGPAYLRMPRASDERLCADNPVRSTHGDAEDQTRDAETGRCEGGLAPRRPNGSMAPRSAHRRAGRPQRQGHDRQVAEYQPVPLGFTPLDKTIGGGLRAGELLLIGGAQGTGKTTMALQMARNIASGGQANVLYICFEHDEPYLLNRLIAMESALAAPARTRPARSRSRTSARRSSAPGWPRAAAPPQLAAQPAARARRSTASPATARTCSCCAARRPRARRQHAAS